MSAKLIVSFLSQKGGVGKSTLARLLATEFAQEGWTVKIVDLNLKQKTSVEWAATREVNGVQPTIEAQALGTVKAALAQTYDLIVFDGKPESEGETLLAAKASNLVVIPTGTSVDDLRPQIMLAEEMCGPRGVERSKIFFVINKTLASDGNLQFARDRIAERGFSCAINDIPLKASYESAQNTGRSIAETKVTTLNRGAKKLAAEIGAQAVKVMGARAA